MAKAPESDDPLAEDLRRNFGESLRAVRANAWLNRAQLVARTGLTQQYGSRVEVGRKNLTLNPMAMLAHAFGRDVATWRSQLSAAANHILRRYDIQLVRSVDFWRPMSQLRRLPAAGGAAHPFSAPFAKGFQGSRVASSQQPFDFAVVMPTTLRTTISDAIQSVFAQQFDGRVQMLIGIDASTSDPARVEQLCRSVPDRHTVLLFYPGYSTSGRHGGLHPTWDGGSLRTLLSYLANSRYIAYLDDDNWWADDHLSGLHAVLSTGAEWAYALRWFVHPASRQPICWDEWESVGPEKGFFSFMGGWVDPNCLAIDKIACEAVLRWWSIPTHGGGDAMAADLLAKATASDRNVFRILSTEFHGAATDRHSVFYEITETDSQHPHRLSWIGDQRYRACGQRAS